MSWKVDYIRMWQEYFSEVMSISQVDDIMNGSQHQELYLRSYKFGKLLEALGKLRFPN